MFVPITQCNDGDKLQFETLEYPSNNSENLYLFSQMACSF